MYAGACKHKCTHAHTHALTTRTPGGQGEFTRTQGRPHARTHARTLDLHDVTREGANARGHTHKLMHTHARLARGGECTCKHAHTHLHTLTHTHTHTHLHTHQHTHTHTTHRHTH